MMNLAICHSEKIKRLNLKFSLFFQHTNPLQSLILIKMMKPKQFFPVFLITICLTCNSQVSINKVTNSHQTLMPYNRIIQPAGMQIYFGDRSLENHALDVALSPDRKWLVVEERYSIVFISTVDKEIKYVLNLDIHADLQGGMNT